MKKVGEDRTEIPVRVTAAFLSAIEADAKRRGLLNVNEYVRAAIAGVNEFTGGTKSRFVGRKDKMVSIIFADEMLKRIFSWAEASEKTLAEVVREIVEAKLPAK